MQISGGQFHLGARVRSALGRAVSPHSSAGAQPAAGSAHTRSCASTPCADVVSIIYIIVTDTADITSAPFTRPQLDIGLFLKIRLWTTYVTLARRLGTGFE